MDKIVYLIVSKGGGIDGMDHKDKGGKIVYASYEKNQGELNPWTERRADVVDVVEQRRKSLRKLDALDKLVLGIEDS